MISLTKILVGLQFYWENMIFVVVVVLLNLYIPPLEMILFKIVVENLRQFNKESSGQQSSFIRYSQEV